MELRDPDSGGAPRPLRMGDKAPGFSARTTMGEMSLEDFRGRWLVFFSHPADFTPVCTTEFVALAKAAPEFEAMDCALLGLSVDSLYSHVAWMQAIEEVFGTKIPFPVIEDPSMAIGRAYGMIDETAADSASIRASYFVDPHGVIRAITCYPYNVGRSVDEMLRLVAALQYADGERALTPEGWRPGQPALAPPATSLTGAARSPDWFCRRLEEKRR
ncbi:MAG: peroxiredoxin [Alphaproteobacteria bacterium]|nr:peroxiredoxin [Alphaproteobacteria bacterium]